MQEREDRKAHVKEMEHARNEPGFKTTVRSRSVQHTLLMQTLTPFLKVCFSPQIAATVASDALSLIDMLMLVQERNQIGKDSGKQASVANKLMDSRKAHNGVMQSDR